ncbi:MAG: LCP family protein, partial [Clostridiales bacterium]
AAQADKGKGLQAMADYLGLNIDETMAFGDGGNDISIIKKAGIGVAMGNAGDNLKEVTNHPKRYGNVTLEAGDNKLTGEQALAYCRIRKIDTDFVRTQRQRTVMSAILKKALTNPFKLYKMAYNSAPYIETDLSKGELMGLVSKAGTCVANIHQTSIPFDGTWDYATIWGNSVIKINTEKNKDKLIDYIYNLSSADIKAQEKEDK